MSLYIDQIRQLVILQKIDSQIIEIDKRLDDAPKEIESIEKAVGAKKDRLAQLKERVDILQEQKLKLQTDIDEDAARIKKSKNKLMMVENTKEYHAMMREMDSLEKTNRMREEEKVTLIEDLQDQETLHDALETEAQTLETELEEKRTSMELELGKMRNKRKKLEKEKKAACDLIPKPIFKRYNHIRTKLDSPVIVSVTDGVCNGCHIKITPQKYIELQKGEQILSCPNCHRLIYWEDHFFPQEETKKAK
ncbi:zinc ribbon domain-containing protein [Desulfoplanes sp.]